MTACGPHPAFIPSKAPRRRSRAVRRYVQFRMRYDTAWRDYGKPVEFVTYEGIKLALFRILQHAAELNAFGAGAAEFYPIYIRAHHYQAIFLAIFLNFAKLALDGTIPAAYVTNTGHRGLSSLFFAIVSLPVWPLQAVFAPVPAQNPA